MGQVGGNLKEFFVAPAADLVAQERDHDGQRESDEDGVETDDQRVFDGRPKLVGVEILLKILHPGPRAFENPLGRREILEGDHDADHRLVREQEQNHDGGQEKQVKAPVARDAPPQTAAFGCGGCLK